jgi:hypothetical protein
MGSGFPGRLFGATQGFSDATSKDARLPVFAYLGGMNIAMEYVSKGEQEFAVPEHGENTAAVLKAHELRLASMKRRLENCDGSTSDTPGIDCTGPAGTVNLSPATAGLPAYVSMPFFDKAGFEDAARMNAGQPAEDSPYEPSTRLKIFNCVGSDWCLKGRTDPEHHRGSLLVEPELGLPFSAKIVTQMNVRLGEGTMLLFPKMKDVMMPIWWLTNELVAPPAFLHPLVKLQGAQGAIAGMQLLCIIIGAVLVLPGIYQLVRGFFAWRAGQKAVLYAVQLFALRSARP